MLNSSNPKSSNSRKVVIYSRISKEADSSNVSSESLSLEAQSNLGHKYAEFNGYEVVGEFSEVFSGKNADNRPKFQKAITLAKSTKLSSSYIAFLGLVGIFAKYLSKSKHSQNTVLTFTRITKRSISQPPPVLCS